MPEISESDEEIGPASGMVWTGSSWGITGRGVWEGNEDGVG